MRNLLAAISFGLLLAGIADLYLGLNPYHFRVVLRHQDGSEGAEVAGGRIAPERIYLETQLHWKLLDRRYREQLVRPDMGPMHILSVPSPLPLILYALWPALWLALWLRDWWRRRGSKRRGFPVVVESKPQREGAAQMPSRRTWRSPL